MTTTEIISKAMALPVLETPPVVFDHPRQCVITGATITEGYPALTAFDGASGLHLDSVTALHSGAISDATARVHKNSWNLGSRVFTESGAHYRPLVSLKSAREQDRPCWRELVRGLPIDHCGELLVLILTDDFKKRHWHNCRVGQIGLATPIFVHSGEHHLSALLTVNWPVMLETLDLLESTYARGFTLRALRTNLLTETKAVAANGFPEALRLEKQLAGLRGTPEFITAHIITQKEG